MLVKLFTSLLSAILLPRSRVSNNRITKCLIIIALDHQTSLAFFKYLLFLNTFKNTNCSYV